MDQALLISPWLKEDARKSEERLITPLINNYTIS
jgi:hypothetical protein